MTKHIKVVAIDVYGTILATDDPDDELPARKGLDDLIQKCHKQVIRVSLHSSEDFQNVKLALQAAGIDIHKFDSFYNLSGNPKDFSEIVRDYSITPRELLVIGDSDADINGAKTIGARYFRVQRYKDHVDDFNLNVIAA